MAEFTEKKVDNEDDDNEDDGDDEIVVQEEKKEEKEEEEDTSLANSDVTTKYQEAAKIAQSTLTEIIQLCVPGASIVELCRAGDQMIVQKASMIFRAKQKSKPVEKGIAFPVCISVNECVCHNSPLTTDTGLTLKDEDMVKIDLGVHVDGYIAVVAHTHIVRAPIEPSTIGTPENATPIVYEKVVVTGSRADTMNAAYTAADLASRLIKPGNTNKQVTEAIKKVAELYGVNLIAGTVMHQMKRYVIDGNKMIILREEADQKAEDCTFEQFEVYAIDVAMTSGEGKPREGDTRTTVYKRAVDKTYKMKMKASRTFYTEVSKRFPTLPFTLRAFDDERAARMGVRECVNHQLLLPYPVLYERTGDQIAHVKFTVLLLSSGTVKITGISIDECSSVYQSDKPSLPDDLQALLLQARTEKDKKKKKKKKGKKGSSSAAVGKDEDGGDDEEEEA